MCVVKLDIADIDPRTTQRKVDGRVQLTLIVDKVDHMLGANKLQGIGLIHKSIEIDKRVGAFYRRHLQA